MNKPQTVHFICRGNVLRSTIAEAYLKSLRIPGVTVMSSGSVADKYRQSNLEAGYLSNTQQLLAKHGLAEYADSEPEQLTQDRLSEDQVAVCLNQVVFEGVDDSFAMPQRTIYWDIVDIGEGQRIVNDDISREAYEEEIFDEITAKVDELVKTL